jgi:WD40 repeat protein
MSTIVIPGAADDDVTRFPSLAALRAAHGELLRRYDKAEETGETDETDSFLDLVERFIGRARATGSLLEGHNDRWAAQSFLDYWTTILYRAGREPPEGSLAEFDTLSGPDLPDDLCPYIGLGAFDEAGHGFFFGRGRLIDEWVGRLNNSRLLAIVGPARSGRSSLVLGGLVPALRDGRLPGSQYWRYYPPMVPGPDPLAKLARLFQPADTDADDWIERQVAALRQDSYCLARVAGEGSDEPALLIVEQFEELFTLCGDEQARQAFVENLMGLIQAPGARHSVILTMLSDEGRRVEHLSTFRQHFEQAEVRLTPPSAGELRDAIEQPAKLVGLKFDEGVVDELVQDICGEAAPLPLLQFSLLKLWEHRERNRVTWAAYRRVGGGRLALARSADAVFQELSPEDQELAKRIMLRMVPPTEGLEVASKRVRREVLYGATEDSARVDRVVSKLVDARLVREIGNETATDAQVELAHEALMTSWPTLAGWLDDQRVAIVTRRRLEARAADWRRLGSGRAGLLDAGQVFEAERWLATPEAAYVGYDDGVLEFVRASRVAVRAEEARQRRAERARRVGIGLVVASIIAAILAWALYRAAVADYRAAVADGERRLMQQQAEASAMAQKESERQAALANSRELAQKAVAGALRRFNDRLDLSLLLVLEARRLADRGQDSGSLLVRGTLLDGLVSNARLTTFLNGHATPVWSLAFSPNGQTLASGDASGTILLHDVPWGQAVSQPLIGHQSREVRSLAFSPDGKVLVSAGSDGTLMLWDVNTGMALGSPLTGHSGSVLSVAFSPDGKMLASGGSDKTIRLWDVAEHHPIDPPLTGHTAAVQSVAFSPDGTMLASGGSDKTIRLWDITDERRHTDPPLTGHLAPVQSVAFSPSGKMLASGSSDKTIILWDVAERQPIGSPLAGHSGSVQSVAFSPDGKTLASGSADKTIRLWDVATRAPRDMPLTGYTERVLRVAFSQDGTSLASGHADGAVILWNVGTTAPSRIGYSLQYPEYILSSAAVARDAKQFVLGRSDGTLTLRNVFDSARLGREPISPRSWPFSGQGASVQSVVFSWDGMVLASGSCAVPTGDFAACEQGEIRLWNVASREQLGAPLTGQTGVVQTVAFNPDGKMLASGSSDGTLLLWNVEDHQPISQLTGHTAGVQSVAFSPDGKKLASGGSDGTLILWDVATHEALGPTLTNHTDQVTTLAFSPDNRMLASGSRDTTVILWDVATRQPLGPPLAEHTGSVLSVTFSPDSQMLASGSADKTVIVRDVPTRQPLSRPFSDHNTSVVGVAFSIDGRTLMSVSDNRSISWDMTFEAWSARACEIIARNWATDEWPQYLDQEPDPFTCPQGVLRQANMDALVGNSSRAEAGFTKAVELASKSVDAGFNNWICWLGAIDRFEKTVLPACERAVALEPENASFRDSRGLARALAGDTSGAIDDFRAFVAWTKETGSFLAFGRKRQAWIDRLQAGGDPFDPATLRALRQE